MITNQKDEKPSLDLKFAQGGRRINPWDDVEEHESRGWGLIQQQLHTRYTQISPECANPYSVERRAEHPSKSKYDTQLGSDRNVIVCSRIVI